VSATDIDSSFGWIAVRKSNISISNAHIYFNGFMGSYYDGVRFGKDRGVDSEEISFRCLGTYAYGIRPFLRVRFQHNWLVVGIWATNEP
jgi:hypothetical protein